MTREPSPLLQDATIRAAITNDPPIGAAEALWFDLSDRLDATSQRRRRLFVMPSPGMRAVFAAIAVIAVLGGGAYLLGPAQGVGVPPPPTAQPTITPTATPGSSLTQDQPTVPTDWTPYTSSRFAYSVEYPAAWVVIPATEDWTSVYAPDHGGPRMDYIGAKPFGSRIYLSSVPLTPDRDAAAWMSTLDSHTAASCDPTSGRHTITIDAVTMRQEDQYCGETVYIVEILGAHNGRFYVIDLVNEAPFTPEERATFDLFLASFQFAPPPVADVTATDTECTMPPIQTPLMATRPGTINVVNHTSKTVLFEVAGAKPGHAFADLQAYFAAEHQRAVAGVPLDGPPDFKRTITESDVPPDGTTTLTLPTAAGTYGITCVYQHGAQATDAFLVGPIEVAP